MSYTIGPAEFTVKEARHRGTKPNSHGGELDKWYVDFLDHEGKFIKDSSGKPSDAFWQRKAPSEVNPGDVVWGTITEGDYGLRFKMEKRPDDAGGGEGREVSSSGSGDYGRRGGKSPDQQAAIERQVALKILAPRINKDGLSDEVKSLAEEIETIIQAATAAEADSGSPTAHNPRASAASQPPDDTAHGFTHYLEESGENAASATLITNWLMSADPVDGALTDKQQDEALKQLQDPETRLEAASKLRGLYVKANGELPEAEVVDPDDQIPF